MNNGEMIIYQTKDGFAQMGLSQNEPGKAFGEKIPEFTEGKRGQFFENETPHGTFCDSPQISLRAIKGTVWLTQEDIANLFDKGRSTVTEHIQNIFSDEELSEDSVCRNFRRTAKDGKEYSVLDYKLEALEKSLTKKE